MVACALAKRGTEPLKDEIASTRGCFCQARLQQEARLGREFVGPDPERMREDETKGHLALRFVVTICWVPMREVEQLTGRPGYLHFWQYARFVIGAPISALATSCRRQISACLVFLALESPCRFCVQTEARQGHRGVTCDQTKPLPAGSDDRRAMLPQLQHACHPQRSLACIQLG